MLLHECCAHVSAPQEKPREDNLFVLIISLMSKDCLTVDGNIDQCLRRSGSFYSVSKQRNQQFANTNFVFWAFIKNIYLEKLIVSSLSEVNERYIW